ncbi:hypothetical protein HispidOSU_019315, partial [Sigmodon hispidus]
MEASQTEIIKMLHSKPKELLTPNVSVWTLKRQFAFVRHSTTPPPGQRFLVLLLLLRFLLHSGSHPTLWILCISTSQ